ncbi:PA14 domain-containing protein [Streptomyces sp. NPDC003011]
MPAATAVAALSFTLLGAVPPAATGTAGRGDATGLPLPAAASGTPNRPAWPAGSFAAGPGGDGEVTTAAAGPADEAVLTGTRPHLAAARRADAVGYEFVIATGGGARTGQVTSSGWLPEPRWQVPAGVLRDGGRYTWTVRTKDRSGRAGEDAAARSFTVAQRLGAQQAGGPVATDTLGPVTVSLATGNVTASVNTAQVPTGSGQLGATFTYDSQAVSGAAGLTGAYYPGDAAGGITAADRPAARRTDARVDFRWGDEAPYPDAAADGAFRVRWSGTLTVPADGTYRLGGAYDGGLRIRVDGTRVLDDWKGALAGDRPVDGSGLTLKAGRAYPVEVDYRRAAGDGGNLALWARGAGHHAPVPASWLEPSGAVLPPGWTVTPAATGPDTATAANAAAAPGGPGTSGAPGGAGTAGGPGAGPAGGTGGTAAGVPGASGASGASDVSGPSGAATGAGQSPGAGASGTGESAPGASGTAPAGAGAAGGPVAGIAAAEDTGLVFAYAGDEACADDQAPAGYVCAVRVPGAGTTHLHYRAGKLVRVVNPGAEVTDFGYTADHRLTTVRPPLLTDWVAAGAGRDTDAARYRIDYRPGTGTAARLTGPDPAGSDASDARRPQRSYAFADGAAELRVAGLSTGQGWARRVTHDTAGLVTTDTDGTGRTTRYTWTPDGRPLSQTDPAGRMTTTVYDGTGMPAGSYGPGPGRCFGADLRPLDPAPEGCAAVPAQTTAFGPDGITTVRADSDGVPQLTTLTRLNEFGLPAALVTDPDGLALTTGYAYDDAFRPVTETSPAGARKTFAYYGATETADNPCTKENDPAPQRGQIRSVGLPEGANGSARVERYVFNARGLPVAVTFGGSDWTCVQYDARGRIVRMSMPGNSSLPAWSVTYDSAHGGDPLTLKAAQHDHSMTSTVDLLGRTVSYTDGQGTRTETRYDRPGRAVLERVGPPGAADAVQVKRTRYDAAGRILTVVLDGRRLATAGHDAAGALRSVRYANGTRLTVERDPAGRITAKDWVLADGTRQSARVTRSQSGTIVDESVAGKDAAPEGPNFTYDPAGRLVGARITGHAYLRDFTARPPAGCPDGTRPDAGANGNVVRLTDRTADGTTVTGYCYDAADRLLATTGERAVTAPQYALNGHLTGYTAGAAEVTQRQDAAERYLGGGVTGADAADVTYTKDIADHIMARTAVTPAGTERILYGHTDMTNPDADLVLDADSRLLARVVPLPGGVVLTAGTRAPGAARTTWSHPTVRGDVFLLTGDDGRRRGGLHQYGLYGEPLTADGTVDTRQVPDNLPGDFDLGWLGRHQVGTEHQGAFFNVVLDTRVFNPGLGRFSAPVAAGPFLNPYEYAAGDPVNHTSINGYSLDVEKE